MAQNAVELFNDAKAVLSTHSPHFEQWQPNCSLEFNVPLPRFVKALHIITTNADFAVRCRMFAQGISWRWTDFVDITPRKLYNFCNWLKTKEGSDAIQKVEMNIKLQKQAAADRVYLSLYHRQRDEYKASISEFRTECEARIAELQELIETERHKLGRFVEDQKRLFRPAGEYMELADAETLERCWNEYKAECATLGVVPRAKTDQLLEKAKVKYGRSVREDHVKQFLGRHGRKEELIDYCNSKVLYYREEDMPSMQELFRGYLASMGSD